MSKSIRVLEQQIDESDIRRYFNALRIESLQKMKAEIDPLLKEIELEKIAITNDSELGQLQKQQQLDILEQEKAEIMNSYFQLKEKLYEMFKTQIQQDINSSRLSKKELQQKIRQEELRNQETSQELTKHYDYQKWTDPINQLNAAKNQSWMTKPLPTVVIPLNKKPEQPVKAALSQKVELTISKITDSNGKPFEGTINLKSATCDSLNEPEKLQHLPPLIVIDQKNRDAPPVSKLISYSMQTNQFEDQKGKLIFPSEPLKVVQKIDTSKIKMEVLKEYKVWNWDVLAEKWVETGSVQVVQNKKELKYQIQPKTRQDILRVFQSIGEPRRSTLPSLLFKVNQIKDLIPTLKQISQAYDKQVKKAQIEHEYRVFEMNNRAGIQATETEIKKLDEQALMLKKINENIKPLGKSMFYDLVSDYFLKKETIKGESSELREELIYIPEDLREIEDHFIYKSLSKLNKRCLPFKLNSEKYEIKGEEYRKQKMESFLEEISNFVTGRDLQKDDVMIKEILLESPNGKFTEKYLLVNPEISFFKGDQKLQKINRAVNSKAILQKINKETLTSLKQKINTWSMRKPSNTVDTSAKQEKSKDAFGFPQDLSVIYQEEKKTIAELIIQSRLNKIKLISVNKFLLRLEIAVLLALPTHQLEKFESELIYNQFLTHKDAPLDQKYILSLPQYRLPQPIFLEAYCEFFQIYVDDNEEVLRNVLTTHVRNNLEIEEKTLMKPVNDPSVLKLFKEIDDVFIESVQKGLFEEKEMEQLKKQKILKIKREYLVVEEWNRNQGIIQRIFSEFFPVCPYKVSTYNELIESMSKYCETRSVLMSEQDIAKFSVQFNSKYTQYRNEPQKGLPGGVSGYQLLASLSQKYGPEAAWAALGGGTCNIDRLMNLTLLQIRSYDEKAASVVKVNKNNIPQFLARKRAEVSNYLNNPNNFVSNVDQSVLKVNNGRSASALNQATEKLEKQKRKNDETIRKNLGIDQNSQPGLQILDNSKSQFSKKLTQTKSPEVKSSQNASIQPKLKSVESLKNQLNKQAEGIDDLAENLRDIMKNVELSAKEQEKVLNEAIEKTIEIMDDRKEVVEKGKERAEEEISEELRKRREEMEKVNKKDVELENTKTRVKRRKMRMEQLKSEMEILEKEGENIKMAASNSLKELLKQKEGKNEK